MRLLRFAALTLLLALLALAIYAVVARTLAAGVTLSIVGAESACNEYADVSCVISNGTSNAISFFKVYDEQQLEYILLVKGDSEDVYMIGRMATFQIQNLLIAYKERFDKDNFIKNLLLDNLLLVDIYTRSQKIKIHHHKSHLTGN